MIKIINGQELVEKISPNFVQVGAEKIMIENYVKYLNMLNEKLERFFQRQKPYIFCKKGCAKCCQNAQYPFTRIEFQYLMIGYNNLPFDLKKQIDENVKKTILDKEKNTKKNFIYQCPFLINNTCSVYNYRGIICRTFGLLNAVEGGSNIPFCALEGLNYSNVYDKENRKISSKMYEKLNIKEAPIAFHIEYDFLTSQDFGNGYGFEFGEVKPLIEWLETEI